MFIHEKALVELGAQVGEGTKVWAFVHILPKVHIGTDCNICDHVFIENDVQIANRVTIKSGAQICDGLRVEDDVFIGANATILPNIIIGKKAIVEAGSVVTKNVPANAIVVGNPAYIVGYSDTIKLLDNSVTEEINSTESRIEGVKQISLPVISDLRGDLSFAEIKQHLPFSPKRYFIVYNVQNKEIRGEHAHKQLSQFLICIVGSCSVMLDDGNQKEEFLLDDPGKGILIPAMVWGVQYKYSSNAVLLVLASDTYDENDYIRDYDQFISMVRTDKIKI